MTASERNVVQPAFCAPVLTGRLSGAIAFAALWTTADLTAQVGAPVTKGKTSIPAVAAPPTIASVPFQLKASRLTCTAPHSIGTRMLSTPPCLRRWNCSAVGVACGATPQKLPGTAPALAAPNRPEKAAEVRIASATAHARARPRRPLPV